MANKLFSKLHLINLKLLPVKAHYFCYAAGISGVIPFLPVFVKHLGVSASVVGLIYTILPFIQFFSKPIISGFADRFQKHKTVMLVTIAIIAMGLFSIYFIPELIDTERSVETAWASKLTCNSNGSKFFLCGENKHSFDTATDNAESLQCNATCTSFNSSSTLCDIWNLPDCAARNESSIQNITKIFTVLHRFDESQVNVCTSLTVMNSKFENSALKDSLICEQEAMLACNVDACDTGTKDPEITLETAFGYYQVWWLLLCLIMGWIAMGGLISVTEAATYNILGEDRHLYGLQRLWATAGWGSIIMVTGFLNDMATTNAGKPNYSPGFYLFLAFLLADMISVSRMEVHFTAKPSDMTGNINQILKTPKVVIFICVVFCVGMMKGVLESFFFWFLTDLGAQSQLLGLSRGVQCFGAEIPAFVLSGWVLKRLGHVNSMSLVLFVYGFRFVCYSFLTNPWWTLPIELCHGVTFGIFYASMTSYASIIAPPGMSSTLQGLLGCVYEGIAMAVGSLTGGFIYGAYGGSRTYRIYGLFGLLMCLFHMAAQRILNRHQSNVIVDKENEEALSEERTKMLEEEATSKFETTQEDVEKGDETDTKDERSLRDKETNRLDEE